MHRGPNFAEAITRLRGWGPGGEGLLTGGGGEPRKHERCRASTNPGVPDVISYLSFLLFFRSVKAEQ